MKIQIAPIPKIGAVGALTSANGPTATIQMKIEGVCGLYCDDCFSLEIISKNIDKIIRKKRKFRTK